MQANAYNVCARPECFIIKLRIAPQKQVTFSVPSDVTANARPRKHNPSTSGQNAVTSFRWVHSKVSAREKIRYVALVLSQGPNIDFPTEEPHCYYIHSVGNPRTSTLGSAFEWQWCTFVEEYHYYRYDASSELRFPRAVVGTTSC